MPLTIRIIWQCTICGAAGVITTARQITLLGALARVRADHQPFTAAPDTPEHAQAMFQIHAGPADLPLPPMSLAAQLQREFNKIQARYKEKRPA